MMYSLVSLESLPFILPLLVLAIIWCAALYGHLNFKHIPIKTVCGFSAFLSLPLSIFMIPMVIKMAFDYDIHLTHIHLFYSSICFGLIVILSMLKIRTMPSVFHIVGLGLFLYGMYSFLA